MKNHFLIVALAAAPALLSAQQVTASARTQAQASVSVPASYSAASRAKIEAAFNAAREKNLPQQPMQQRIAEGQAKGANDAQVAGAVQKTEARLEASQAAMIRAGRTHPQPQEVASGEQAMERGATDAQIEALAKHAPSAQSLTVALSVLTKLEAEGRPVSNAVASIQSKLDARASDDAIVALLDGNAAAGTHASGSSAATAGNSNGAASNGAGIGAAVSGAVHGVVGVGKP
jgi:hypothetical protein